ncbi:hypothetical protein FNH08_19860 [Streptomyces spongiae]|uniref:Uncharacterized protein n=1 Tax=Streptomyces spongiae TaxID=565072 RepID=A0A5N8XJP1_9ACTN|nr:hypothetical protein [Streptomyces spongiae]
MDVPQEHLQWLGKMIPEARLHKAGRVAPDPGQQVAVGVLRQVEQGGLSVGEVRPDVGEAGPERRREPGQRHDERSVPE